MSKNMPSIENKVLQAAMRRPPMAFSKFCELVLDEATSLLDKTDGRLRFLDYTKERVVPGAIKGKMQEYPEIFARMKNQGLVGIAINSKKTVICNNVQEEGWFKEFLAEVRGKAQGKNNTPERLRGLLKRYDDEVLRFIKSEIAVPILIGEEEVIGVLSVHSDKRNAFQDDDRVKLEHFALIVKAGLLNRRLIVQEELSAIEREMISSYQLKEVARNIALGIKKTLEDAIPNIFLYKRNFERPQEREFEFLTSAEDNKEKELGNFMPRTTKGIGLGMQAIEAVENKKQDVFFVAERVQDDQGSPTAKKQGIYTTGCVPLVIDDSVVGLLYVHFKNKIHFFTDEEKKTLNLFAKSAVVAIKNATSVQTYSEQFGDEHFKNKIQSFTDEEKKTLNLFAKSAVVAIKNATTSPTYSEQFGEVLLKEIEDLAKNTLGPEDNVNIKLLKNLNDFAEKIRQTRGDKEISQAILKEVADLCKILELPDDFGKTFEKFQKNEGILYSLPYYRDHFVHMFQVFLLGYVIINRWWQCPVTFLSQDENNKLATLQTWFLAAIQHDIAYYIEKADSWVPTLAENTLGLKSMAPSGSYNWSSILTKPNNMKYIEQLSNNFVNHFCNGLTVSDLFEKEVNFKRWYMNHLLDYHDHGTLSGLALLHYQRPKTIENIVQDAALAVVLHNYCKKKDENPPMGQLIFADFPLAGLLAYCDAAQEWGRAKTDKNELRLIDPNVQFESLTVTCNMVEVILTYNLTDMSKKSGLEIEDERNNVRTALINSAECLSAWTGVGDKKDDFYAFYIRAGEQLDANSKPVNGRDIWSFPVVCRVSKRKTNKNVGVSNP